MVFFRRACLNSLKARARMIGNGKPATKEYKLKSTVFFRMVPKIGVLKNWSKYFSPTHGLPQIPFLALNSLKAIRTPLIGI